MPEVLLDQNEMAKGFKYFAIGAFEPSDDGNMLAFSTDTTGYRQYTLQVKDLRTGKILPDKVERVTSTEWSNDGKYLFYGQEDPVRSATTRSFAMLSVPPIRTRLSLRRRTSSSVSA